MVLGEVATIAPREERGRSRDGGQSVLPHADSLLASLLLPLLQPLPAKVVLFAGGVMGHPSFGRGLQLHLCSRREKQGGRGG